MGKTPLYREVIYTYGGSSTLTLGKDAIAERSNCIRILYGGRLVMKRAFLLLILLLPVALACSEETPPPATFAPIIIDATPTRPALRPTSTPPPPPPPPPTAAAAAAAAAVTVTTYVVGNTDGEGVFIRNTPDLEDKVKAWPDGTEMVEVGPPRSLGQTIWNNVRDPDGTVGWVPAQYLVKAEQ